MGKNKDKGDGQDLLAKNLKTLRAAMDRKVPNQIDHALVVDYTKADAVLVAKKRHNAAVMMADREGSEFEQSEEARERVAVAAAALAVAEEELAEATLVVWFKALGGQEMEDLMAEHLPTKEQQEELRRQLLFQGLPTTERLQYNSETFPPAIIAASAVDPVISDEEAEEFWTSRNISRGERAKMLKAAYGVNDIVR